VIGHRGVLMAAAAAAPLLLLAGCGIQPSGITVLGAAPQEPSAVAATIPTTVAGETTFALLFYQDGELEPVYRTVPTSTLNDMLVITQLRAGPTRTELAAGYSSAMPDGLVVTPKTDDQAWAYGFSETVNQAALAQFVCTVQIYSQKQVGWKDLTKNGYNPLSWLTCSDITRQFIPLLSTGGTDTPDVVGTPTASAQQ
jgi:hypothetical protein